MILILLSLDQWEIFPINETYVFASGLCNAPLVVGFVNEWRTFQVFCRSWCFKNKPEETKICKASMLQKMLVFYNVSRHI